MTARASRRRLRRVAVITGTRAEYGLLCSTMAAIKEHHRLQLQLVVTGMHFLRKFGRTVDEIIRDGWDVDARVKMQTGADGTLDQALGVSRGVAGIARFLEGADTDIVVVLGDRIEAMAGALAAVTTGRLLAHIHGGDLAPGDFDDSLRHAITKLAHLHLAATPAAARRIIRMGEAPQRVHCVGAPGLDRLRELAREYRRPKTLTGRALVVQHPRGRSAARERRTMSAILRAVAKEGLHRTIIYPNTDRGHSGIIAAIEADCRRPGSEHVTVVRSLDRDDYLQRLIEADVLVGNSSSGIIEAPVAGTPSVNVGPRQHGREVGGRSVIHADESLASIRAALHSVLGRSPGTAGTTVYGRGATGPKIAALLARVSLDERFRRKVNAY